MNFDSSDAGTVVILPEQTYFIIDSRYIEIANAEVKQAQVILQKDALAQVREILESHHVKHLYMENKATVAYAKFARHCRASKWTQAVRCATQWTLSAQSKGKKSWMPCAVRR